MKLLIIGAGGHGRSCAELAELGDKYSSIAFLDDAYPVTQQSLGLLV